MDIKSTVNKNKYALSVFALLAMPCLIFDGFESALTLACRLFLCVSVALFFAPYLHTDIKKERAVSAVFSLLSIISCNVIFLSEDVHILLSLFCFFLALFVNGKAKILTAVFAGLCVAVQPLSLLFLVPSIVVIQLIKKQKLFAGMSAVFSVAVFVLTKFLESTEFYADQFSSYYLSLHLIHFSKTHTEVLMQYSICSIPLVAVALVYLVKLFLNGRKFESIAVLACVLLSVVAFAMSKNTHTVFMILIPFFASFISLDSEDGFGKTNEEIGRLFIKHFLLFLLLVAFTAGFPAVFGQIPFESDFFSKATFIIFRQE
ncbi:MAG: hypothetical protein IJ447_09055 [Clostridia bacterium]|nr:hypothetical protein [Clostridia bacterium]